MKLRSHAAKHCLLLALFSYLVVVSEALVKADGLIISEFSAANNAGLRDEDGEFSDWIEICNTGRQPISVGGWYLSNDTQDLTPWRFPDVVIGGQSFLLVFASGKDRRTAGGELHTSFKLHRDGEYLALVRPGANVLAIQALNDWAISPDFLIQAQLENAQVIVGDRGHFESPTPGSGNGEASLGLVADPVLGRRHGFYEAPFEVTITCATEGATARYTLDGSAPTPSTGHEYAGPILVDRTTTLRAAAFLEGWRPLRVVTRTYLFLDDVVRQNAASALAAGFPPTWNGQSADYGLDPRVADPDGGDNFGGKYTASLKEDLRSLPSMSIVMNIDDMFGPQGIYSNPTYRGDNWERPASVEVIYPDGQEGFQENAGIRIQGGAFRRFNLTLKKSFRLIFREKYGASKLDYPLFGPDATDEFDNFILRANSNDAWPYGGANALYVRDAFAMDTVRAMGNLSSHSTFVHLYINGLYWGLYNPVERPDAAFSASYRGGDEDTWDAINQDSVPDGNYDAWNRLLAMLNEDTSSAEVYQRLQATTQMVRATPSTRTCSTCRT